MTTSGSYSQLKNRGGLVQQIPVPYNFASNKLAALASAIHELIIPISYAKTSYVAWLPQGAFIDSFGLSNTAAWTAGSTIEVSSLNPLGATSSTAPTVANVGIAGSSTYSYSYVPLIGSSQSWSLASPVGSTTTGNLVLSGTNYNLLSLTAVTGASVYAVYRTAAPAGYELGLIGYTNSLTFVDNGSLLAAPNTNEPTAAGDLLTAISLSLNVISTPVFTFASSPIITASNVPIGVQQVIVSLAGTTATAGSGYFVIKYSNTISAPSQI